MYKKILKLLTETPDARERRHRSKYLVDIVKETHQLNWENFETCATEYASLIRAWQCVTKDNEHLRGKDYDPDGEILRQKKILELGYEINNNILMNTIKKAWDEQA